MGKLPVKDMLFVGLEPSSRLALIKQLEKSIPGGAQFREQLAIGEKIEMEHTSDTKEARKIAMDHLKELPDYYTRLKKMEKKGKSELGKAIDECRDMIDNELDELEKAVGMGGGTPPAAPGGMGGGGRGAERPGHKYIRREGQPGAFKYIYRDEQTGQEVEGGEPSLEHIPHEHMEYGKTYHLADGTSVEWHGKNPAGQHIVGVHGQAGQPSQLKILHQDTQFRTESEPEQQTLPSDDPVVKQLRERHEKDTQKLEANKDALKKEIKDSLSRGVAPSVIAKLISQKHDYISPPNAKDLVNEVFHSTPRGYYSQTGTKEQPAQPETEKPAGKPTEKPKKRGYLNPEQESAISKIKEEHDVSDYKIGRNPSNKKEFFVIGKDSGGKDKAFIIGKSGELKAMGVYSKPENQGSKAEEKPAGQGDVKPASGQRMSTKELDNQWGRKQTEFNYARHYSVHVDNLPENIKLDKLSVTEVSGNAIPQSNPQGMPSDKMYLMKHKDTGHTYLVDPQGYDYPRYTLKLNGYKVSEKPTGGEMKKSISGQLMKNVAGRMFYGLDPDSRRELEKALGGAGTGQERAGHKYHRREWDAGDRRWVYFYKDEQGKEVGVNYTDIIKRGLPSVKHSEKQEMVVKEREARKREQGSKEKEDGINIGIEHPVRFENGKFVTKSDQGKKWEMDEDEFRELLENLDYNADGRENIIKKLKHGEPTDKMSAIKKEAGVKEKPEPEVDYEKEENNPFKLYPPENQYRIEKFHEITNKIKDMIKTGKKWDEIENYMNKEDEKSGYGTGDTVSREAAYSYWEKNSEVAKKENVEEKRKKQEEALAQERRIRSIQERVAKLDPGLKGLMDKINTFIKSSKPGDKIPGEVQLGIKKYGLDNVKRLWNLAAKLHTEELFKQ